MVALSSPVVSLVVASAVVLGGAFGAAAMLDVEFGFSPSLPAAGEAATVSVAGETLAIPPAYVRFDDQRRPGPRARIDLALPWPAPAAGDPDAGAEPVVFATIEPREGDLDTTARVATVYRRFFLGEPAEGPAGLAAQRLRPGSGYEDEILFHEPGAVRPFAARCFAADGDHAAGADTCLREVRFGRGLIMSYRFPFALLADWRALDRSMKAAADSFLVAKTAAAVPATP